MSRIPFFAYTVLSRIGQVSNKTPSNSDHQNSTSVLRRIWYTLRFLMILDNCKLSDIVQQIMSNEDFTNYTKCFKAVRDLYKEKYRGIFEIPMLTQKESTWTSDKEGSYKTAYASFLSILYLNNMDQTKYGSFIKKGAEDFATGQENVYLTHIEDTQYILSIHKYDQAYHNKQKKQQQNYDKGHMSSKNDDHSTTGNVPNIVEMSFAQMEG